MRLKLNKALLYGVFYRVALTAEKRIITTKQLRSWHNVGQIQALAKW